MLTAWDCIGLVPPTHYVRIVGGRALYEEAIYYDDTPGDKVKLARLEDGLRQVNRWVDAETPVELVEARTGKVVWCEDCARNLLDNTIER